MRLNWQQLNIFSVIVEEGGVAAAARELGISKFIAEQAYHGSEIAVQAAREAVQRFASVK